MQQPPLAAPPQKVPSSGATRAQDPDSTLPDLIRFLDEHPQYNMVAEAARVSDAGALHLACAYCDPALG